MIEIQHNVQIDAERTIRYTAYDLSARDGSLVEDSATVVCRVVKQAATPEYWNGTAWVEADPGNLAMTEDAIQTGVYELAVTLDEEGVDYIVKCWDTVAAHKALVGTATVRGGATADTLETDVAAVPAANWAHDDRTLTNATNVTTVAAADVTVTIAVSHDPHRQVGDTLVLQQGTTPTLTLTVYSGTTPRDVSDFDFYFGAKARRGDSTYLCSKAPADFNKDDAASGIATVPLALTDLAAATEHGVYEIKMIDGSAVERPAQGALAVKPKVLS